MVFCTEFLDGWWSWELLRRSCVRCGWCRATHGTIRTVHTIYAAALKTTIHPDREGNKLESMSRDAHDFNNIESLLQSKAPKEFHAILTEILACFLPGWAKVLWAPLYIYIYIYIYMQHISLNLFLYLLDIYFHVYASLFRAFTDNIRFRTYIPRFVTLHHMT